jgi:hypothetical protein
VDIEEPRSRIREIPPKKRRVRQNTPEATTQTPLQNNPQIIEINPEKRLPENTPPLQAVPPPAKVLEPSTTAPGQTQRGTRENPRKIGPIVPPPIGVE